MTHEFLSTIIAFNFGRERGSARSTAPVVSTTDPFKKVGDHKVDFEGMDKLAEKAAIETDEKLAQDECAATQFDCKHCSEIKGMACK